MSYGQTLEQYIEKIEEGNVSEVALSHRGLDDAKCAAVAVALARTPVPRVVDAQSNNITSEGVKELCKSLRESRTIVEVNLENNLIDDEGAKALADVVAVNETLVALHLGGNRVSPAMLDTLSFNVSLNTQPASFKAAVPKLRAGDPSITELDLSDAKALSPMLIRTVLEGNATVEVLSLARTGLGDGGCGFVGELVKSVTALKSLDLSGNGITSHGVKTLAEGLRENKSITRLTLCNNKLSDEAARALSELLRTNDQITEIDASDNAISNTALEGVAHALDLNRQPLALKRAYYASQVNDPKHKVIDFAWIEGMQRCAHFLAPVLKFNREVTHVNFSNARITDTGADALATVLKVNRCIQSLELANNDISSTGASNMARALLSNPTLTSLNLANNNICDIAAAEFATTLLTNNQLTFLNLELNQISAKLMDEAAGLIVINAQPRGLKAVLPAIEANALTVTTVDFSKYDGERYHTDESARVLCRALASNSVVTSIDLGFNNIGDGGATYFADLLKINGSLTSLMLPECAIGDKGGCLLAESLRSNTSLQILNLRGNPVSEVTGAEFLEVLKDNHYLAVFNVEQTRIGDAMVNDLCIACALNTQPQGLKGVIPQLRSCDPSVSELDLSQFDGHQYFNDASLAILCHELRGNANVRVLNVSNNEFGPEGCKALADLVADPGCALVELSVANNNLGSEGVSILADAIARNNTVVTLDIRATGATSSGVLAVAAALDTNDSVQVVHVTKTPEISPRAMVELTRQLAINSQCRSLKAVLPLVLANDPSLTSIVIVGDGEASAFGDTSANLLALALAKNTNVTHVDLRNNDITSEGAEYLADMLEDNKSIAEVSLMSNRIDDNGARALINILSANDTLRMLNLDNNPITEPVYGELDYMLRVNNAPVALKKLMVGISTNSPDITVANFAGGTSNALFNDDSLHILCSILVSNTNVQEVNLSANDISDDGAQLLADMLRANTALRKLDISHNRVTNEGAYALFLTLKVNHTLSELNLDGNTIGADLLEQISANLNINKQPLRQPKHAKAEFKKRPHVADVDNETQFRDVDYMMDCENQIMEDAMQDLVAPPKRVPLTGNPPAIMATSNSSK